MAEEATAATPAGERQAQLPMIVGGVVVARVDRRRLDVALGGKESHRRRPGRGHITQTGDAGRRHGGEGHSRRQPGRRGRHGRGARSIRATTRSPSIARSAELADAEANAAAAGTGVPIAEVSTPQRREQATGGVEEAQAGIAVADSQVEAARRSWSPRRRGCASAKPTATKSARATSSGSSRWSRRKEIAQQQFDAAVAAADAARAAADAAQVGRRRRADRDRGRAAARRRRPAPPPRRPRPALQTARTAPQQLAGDAARAAASAEARVQQMRAALAQAELNLERTTIKAPTAGTVSRKTVEVGAGGAARPAADGAGRR